MRITDAFRGEHGALNAQLDHLEARLAVGDDLPALRAAAAMLGAALRRHAELEDRLLFDAADAAAEAELPALRAMRGEHEEIARLLDALASTRDIRDARELLVDVIDVARLHFLKEEEVAFELVEGMLGEARLLELGGAWGARRGVHLSHR